MRAELPAVPVLEPGSYARLTTISSIQKPKGAMDQQSRAPTPKSDVSVSIRQGRLEFGGSKTGALVNCCLRFRNASSQAPLQTIGLSLVPCPLSRSVSRAAMLANPLMNWR